MPIPLARMCQHNGFARVSQGVAALRDFDPAYDRLGSKREFPHFGLMSASSASSGHWVANASAALPIAAVSTCSKAGPYSITSSASNWIEFGTSMPSALAVRRLMTYSNLVVCNTGTDRSSPALDPSAGLPLIATVMVRRASYTSVTECSLSLLRLNNLAVKMPSGMAQYWQDRGEANQKENCGDSQQRNNDKTPDRHHQRIGYDGSNRGFDRPCGAHLFVQEHRKGNHRNRQRHHGEVEPDDGAIYDQRAAPPGCKHLVHKVRDRNRRICSE